MKRQVSIMRGVNFAFPHSERDQFYTPRQVRILIGASALVVLILVALPFFLQRLETNEVRKRSIVARDTEILRQEVDAAAPVLARKATLDSIYDALNSRMALRQRIEASDYRVDRLLVHLAELTPEGIVLTRVTFEPPSAQRGRPGRTGVDPELPEELAKASVLTIAGIARNSTTFSNFTRTLENSPLFHAPQQSYDYMGSSINFTVTTRLPGSGVALVEEEGG
jgi:Tfp pilus assembly protein PilN